MATDNDSIDLACIGLTNAVKKYCKKRKRDFPNQQVQHACHILRQLTMKRHALQQGLIALEQCWNEWNSHITAETNMTHLLTHVFHHYLRLRDGMNLMSSGECRHDGDVQLARNTKFPSRLNQQSHRSDGYTKLFSSQYYSGYGWDEFFDSNVGVLQRLKLALGGKHNCWDALLEYGAQAFESSLDQHETICQEIQSKFDELRNRIVNDVSQHCTNVTMLTQDKTERLQVTLKGGAVLSLQRHGNDFQVHDINGCLPNGWQVPDWNRAMEYTPPTKRRRDKDGSNSTGAKKQKAKQKTCTQQAPVVDGIKVKVKSTESPEDKKESVEVSLVALKGGEEYADALEKSREVLEAEDTDMEKSIQTKRTVDEVTELRKDVADARSKVERMKRVVIRVTQRQDEFDEELWDARECLREASMTLGSSLLSLCTVDNDRDACEKNLQEARRCFSEARDLVKKQESIHQLLCKQTNDSSEEARAIRRKLLLLRGRAHVNLGIALVESSRMKCPEHERKGLEKDAFVELDSAKACVNSIRARAVTDETKGASPSETAIDRLEADQLEALTNRWISIGLWHQKRFKDAVVASEKGSKFFIVRRNCVPDEDVQAAEVELGIESFYASTTLADLALGALEKLQIVIQGHPKRQDCLSKGHELFSISKSAYNRASLISTNLYDLVDACKSSSLAKETLRENGILASHEIEKTIEQISSWWEQKREGNVLHPKDGTSNEESEPLRNDLFASGQSRRSQSNSPVKRFTINETSSRRASKRRNQGGNGLSRSVGTTNSNNSASNSTQNSNVQYRKWGDALLPQVKTDSGETVPLITYPAGPPELPPGFKPYLPTNQ